MLPLLDAGVVTPGYVPASSFVAGYGLAQAMPGPLFSFGAYLGAISTSGPGGVAGAVVGTVALFLPGAVLVLAALPVLGAASRTRRRRRGAAWHQRRGRRHPRGSARDPGRDVRRDVARDRGGRAGRRHRVAAWTVCRRWPSSPGRRSRSPLARHRGRLVGVRRWGRRARLGTRDSGSTAGLRPAWRPPRDRDRRRRPAGSARTWRRRRPAAAPRWCRSSPASAARRRPARAPRLTRARPPPTSGRTARTAWRPRRPGHPARGRAPRAGSCRRRSARPRSPPASRPARSGSRSRAGCARPGRAPHRRPDRRQVGRDRGPDAKAGGGLDLGRDDRREPVLERDRADRERRRAALVARDGEQVLDESVEPLGLLLDGLDHLDPDRLRDPVPLLAEDLRARGGSS